MQRMLKDNGLSLAVAALFLLTLLGHFLAGRMEFNAEQLAHGGASVGYVAYATTGHFVESVFENWESEFLQMGLYVFMTAYLVQRGSAESRKPADEREASGDADESEDDPSTHRTDADAPWPVKRGGWISRWYSFSLSIAFLLLFLFSFAGHVLGGATEYNEGQRAHGEPTVTTLQYATTSRFWFESFQNWQSEFLSVLAIVVLSIWLRQKGSPESKPVHKPNRETGAS